MTTWRILEWSRERGRGAVTSPHFERVEFDASCADVDDFRVGEPVRVELEHARGVDRVRRVTPDEPRFRARDATSTAPVLDEALRSAAEVALGQATGWWDARVVPGADKVALQLDENNFAYGASAELVVFLPSYLELPMRFAPKLFRLADDAARTYLAGRTELSASDLAVAIIDDEDRFFFVVGSRVEFSRIERGPAP